MMVSVSDLPAELIIRSPSEPAHRNLAALACAAVSIGSRRTVRVRLQVVARALGFESVEACPWHALRPEHTAYVRAVVADRYAPATANAILAALRSALLQGWRLGVWDHDQHARLATLAPIAGTRRPRGRLLSAGEVERLRDGAGEGARGARDRAAIALLIGGGMRRAEACSLDASHALREGLQVIGKGNRERLVPLPAWARLDVAAWLAVRGDAPGALLHPVNKAGRIEARRMTATGLYLALAELTDRTGVNAWSPHDGRRTLASTLLDAGADLATVAGVLGHASTDTTRRYDLRDDRTRAAAVARLDRWVSERE